MTSTMQDGTATVPDGHRRTPGAADSLAFKSAMRSQWDRSAQGWNDHAPQIRAWLAIATRAMLDMASVTPGSRVLDVAAGAGDQTLDVAARVGRGGEVVATDLSPSILALAQRNATQAGHANVRTQVADGESLPFADQCFDAVVCRLGLMFFPDPLRGLQEMHRVLRPGGGICTVVFAGPAHNPCITTVMAAALKHAGLPPGDPFQAGTLLSLGRDGLADAMFRQAGFRDVATTSIDAPFRLPEARDYVDFIRASASPVKAILDRLDEAAAAAAWRDIEERLQVFGTPAGWAGPNRLLLTAGRR